MPFVIDIYSKKNVNGTRSSCGVQIGYRTIRMVAVMGSKHGNSFFSIENLFSFFYVVSSFRINFGLD